MIGTSFYLNTATVAVENIGRIDTITVEVTFDVTILAGRNATNRTFFPQALMAVLGSERASLKGDIDHGIITLELNGETYTRDFTCPNGSVVFAGDPYLENSLVTDLFAFLLESESNPARRAIVMRTSMNSFFVQSTSMKSKPGSVTSKLKSATWTLNSANSRIQNSKTADTY